MAVKLSLLEICRRFVVFTAFTACAVAVILLALLLIPSASSRSTDRPWALIAVVLMRIVPLIVYVKIQSSSTRISPSVRAMAVTLGLFSISLSVFFMHMLPAGMSLSEAISEFFSSSEFFEVTLDMWPCAVMLIFAKEKAEKAGTNAAPEEVGTD